jgi:hypothetical protein
MSTLRGVVVVLLVAVGLLAFGASAYAATFTPETGIEQTFLPKYGTTYSSTEQSYVVPPGVTQLHVLAVGAPGESIQGPGGAGTEATSVLNVHEGERLWIAFERGAAAGSGDKPSGCPGFSGGVYTGGSKWEYSGGGEGGGDAEVRTVAPEVEELVPDESLESRLIVAGGGGGAGGAVREPYTYKLREGETQDESILEITDPEPGHFKYVPDTLGGTGGAGGAAGVPGPAGDGGGGLYSNSNNTEEVETREVVESNGTPHLVPVKVKINEAPHADGSAGGGGGGGYAVGEHPPGPTLNGTGGSAGTDGASGDEATFHAAGQGGNGCSEGGGGGAGYYAGGGGRRWLLGRRRRRCRRQLRARGFELPGLSRRLPARGHRVGGKCGTRGGGAADTPIRARTRTGHFLGRLHRRPEADGAVGRIRPWRELQAHLRRHRKHPDAVPKLS